MAYKNSGAMKFNDATDLVIRADPDGTVESCYNLADGVEYIQECLQEAEVIITNNSASNKTLYKITVNASPKYAVIANETVAAGATKTVKVLKDSVLGHTATTVTVVSGDATSLSTVGTLIGGDCELEFND